MNIELLNSYPEDNSLNRPINRGSMTLLRDLITYKVENFSNVKNIVELGVGGGGKHVFWGNVFLDANVYGVEIFHPNGEWASSLNKEMFDFFMKGYECSTRQVVDLENVTLLHGFDSYKQETIDVLVKYLNDEKLDFIVDDSDPNGNEVQTDRINAHNMWKTILKDDGFFWSETLMGQGTDNAIALQGTEKNEEFMKEYARNGWVLFDLTPYANYERLQAPSNSYFGIWAHDLGLYKDVLLKYEDCILYGRENF